MQADQNSREHLSSSWIPKRVQPLPTLHWKSICTAEYENPNRLMLFSIPNTSDLIFHFKRISPLLPDAWNDRQYLLYLPVLHLTRRSLSSFNSRVNRFIPFSIRNPQSWVLWSDFHPAPWTFHCICRQGSWSRFWITGKTPFHLTSSIVCIFSACALIFPFRSTCTRKFFNSSSAGHPELFWKLPASYSIVSILQQNGNAFRARFPPPANSTMGSGNNNIPLFVLFCWKWWGTVHGIVSKLAELQNISAQENIFGPQITPLYLPTAIRWSCCQLGSQQVICKHMALHFRLVSIYISFRVMCFALQQK